MSKTVDKNSSVNYSIITEVPGDRITEEAMRMLDTRYGLAYTRCANKDLLELGCGPGLGLSYLAKRARNVVGGDRNPAVLSDALTKQKITLPLLCLDAQSLPFADHSFDIVLLYEAIYYLASPDEFLCECRRILRPEGQLIITLPNKSWPGFNPSPFSTRYFSANELYELFLAHKFRIEVYGGFPSEASTLSQKFVQLIRRFAVRAHLIPKTFKGKEKLKRIFYGSLKTISNEFTDSHLKMDPLTVIPKGQVKPEFRVLYAIATA